MLKGSWRCEGKTKTVVLVNEGKVATEKSRSEGGAAQAHLQDEWSL
jgi:hypothetical protein